MKPTIQITEAEYLAMREKLERLRGQVKLQRHLLKVARATISRLVTEALRQQREGAA